MDERSRWERMLADAVVEREGQHRRICQLCIDLLGASGGGVSMVTSAGNHGVIYASDDRAAQIEDLQVTLGEGPCVDAVRTGGPILVGDLDEPGDLALDRWPGFVEGARAAGVRAVCAFPLRIGAISLGAFDLYRDQTWDLDAGQLSAALMAADVAALALLHLDTGRTDAFRDDVAARSSYQLQVHQATGMVQIQLAVATEAALLMLRARAFADARPLADIADDVVGRRLRFSREES